MSKLSGRQLPGFFVGLVYFFIFGGYIPGLWYSGKLIRDLDSGYSAGDAITVFFGINQAAFPLGALAPTIKAFADAKNALGRIIPLMDRTPKINYEDKGGIQKDCFDGNVEFRNVNFNYPSRKDVVVLNKISFKINKGEKVALVGESGCGKTTCTYLLERFYDTDGGEIFIDGNNIKEYNIKWLRQNIGYVGQEPVLFATTIMQNILFAKNGASHEEVIQATKRANAFDFIMKLDNKFDTYVGLGGTQLSGNII